MQGTYVEGIKEEVVLSPAHALSLIASGEGIKLKTSLVDIDNTTSALIKYYVVLYRMFVCQLLLMHAETVINMPF